MRLALEIVLATPPSLARAPEFDWGNVLTTRIVLGGASYSEQDAGERSSSRVISGALIPIASEYSATIRRSLASHSHHSSASPVVASGVVAINGDFSHSDLREALHPSALGVESVQLVFVHGEVNSQAMDHSWCEHSSVAASIECRCVPVESYKELVCVAELCGAQIIDSWSELLPLAVGLEPLELQLVELSAPSLGGADADSEDEDDADGDSLRIGTRSYARLFLRVDRAKSPHSSSLPIKTLLARGSTHSEAAELQQNVQKALRRVTNALRCGHVLPSGGAFLCACAAEIRAEVTRRSSLVRDEEESFEDSLMNVALGRMTEALSRLSVLLLQNTGQAASDLRSGGASFFDCFSRVREVQVNYLQGIQDGASDRGDDAADAIRIKFYATCHFGGSDFSVLPKRARDENRRLDDYRSVKAAFQRSFRLVDLALSVAAYQINASEQHHQQ